MSDSTIGNVVGNSVAGSTIAATLLGYLPNALGVIGSILGIIWFMVSIDETKTFQACLQRRRDRKVAKLKAKLLLLEPK